MWWTAVAIVIYTTASSSGTIIYPYTNEIPNIRHQGNQGYHAPLGHTDPCLDIQFKVSA